MATRLNTSAPRPATMGASASDAAIGQPSFSVEIPTA